MGTLLNRRRYMGGVRGGGYLQFEDDEFWRICCINYGDHDGSTPIGITAEQCAAVTTLTSGYNTSYFRDNQSILSVNDLKYFTGITSNMGGWIFKGCSNLITATIPKNVTRLTDYLFYGCENLETVTLENPTIINIIDNICFADCYKLSGFVLPPNLTSIGAQAFQRNYMMSSIDIPNGVTTIQNSAFTGCSSVTSISGFANITNIGQSSFHSLRYTGHIDLNGLVSVGNSAFESAKITSLHIGSNCTTITGAAFFNMTNCQWVVIDATAPPTLTSTNGFGLGTYPIYVPDSAYNDYVAANNWSSYGTRIKKISEKP